MARKKAENTASIEKTFVTAGSTIRVAAKILPDDAVPRSEKIALNPSTEERAHPILPEPASPAGNFKTKDVNSGNFDLGRARTEIVKTERSMTGIVRIRSAKMDSVGIKNVQAGISGTAKKTSSISFKVTFLILVLSLASFIGLGILAVNGLRMQRISRDLTGQYEQALASDSFSQFKSFLDAIQASSGISQSLAETFYMLRNTLSRQELAAMMRDDYHRVFARETSLLGGGAFFEPNAFYSDIYRFHYFCSKELTPLGTIPPEEEAKWIGYDVQTDTADEWSWDEDTYETDWYLVALPKDWNRASSRSDRYYWSELYVDDSVDALMVTVSLPIYSPAKRIVGVATVDVSLSTLQKMVAAFPPPTPSTRIAGFSVINNATFAVSGTESYDIVEYQEGSWLAHLTELDPGETITSDINLDGDDYTLMASVHDSGIGLAILIPNAEKYEVIEKLQNSNKFTVILIVLVMISIIILVVFALSRWVVQPIRRTFRVLETLAMGDLTHVISASGSGELAQMMHMIGQTQEGIKSLITAIGEKARALANVGIELQNMMADSIKTAIRINENAQNVKTKSVNQADGIIKTSATMTEIIGNIENLNKHIEDQAESISRSSASIEEMLANISSITVSLGKNDRDLQDLQEASSEGNNSLQQVSADIQEIAKESEGLLQINAVMKNIASQTNLLSMNAAIEAAHAGEAGKGFAVVADEIRKLAENSGNQSKTISTVLKKIKESIDKITISTGIVLNKFEAIGVGVKTVSEQEENIRNAMEEQGQGSQEVLDAIGQLKEITQQVKEGSREMLNGSRVVVEESKNLDGVTQEIAGDMNEMVAGSDQINGIVNRVNELSGKNRDNIDLLVQEISRFKV
ncbi:MAG: methyl-accepting chemotaxis protein [Treponema sp.]|nr:methyl-accepting chemotaxis protein [Treponema sp.]